MGARAGAHLHEHDHGGRHHVPDAAVESEVVLLGSQGGSRITADNWRALPHTINYEIVSRIGAHIPKLVV